MKPRIPLFRKLLRILGRIVVALVPILLTAVTAVVLWVNTPGGHERLRALIEQQVRREVPGFTLGALEGRLPGEIIVRDVRVDDLDGRPAVRVARIRATVALAPLLHHTIRLDSLAVVDPWVLARAGADGTLNLSHLRQPAARKPPSAPSRWGLDLHGLDLTNGTVIYDSPTQSARVSGLAVAGVAHLRGDNVGGRIRLGAEADVEGRHLRVALAAAAEVTGKLVDVSLGGLAVSGVTPTGVVAVRGTAHGPLARLALDLRLLLPDEGQAHVEGHVGVARVPTYDLTLWSRGVNPRALVATAPTGRIGARASAVGRGLPPGAGSQARVRLELLPSDVRELRDLTALVRAEIAERAWRLDELVARTPGAEVRATGRGRDRAFALELAAHLDTKHAGKLVPASLGGVADVKVHASGTFPQRLDVHAEGSGHDIRAGKARLDHFTLDLAAAGSLRSPRGRLRLDASGLRPAPGQLVKQARVDLATGDRLRLAVDLQGPTINASVRADGQVTPRRAQVAIRKLDARYGEYQVALQSTTNVRWEAGRLVEVEGLDAAVLDGRIRGRLAYRPRPRGRPRLEAHLTATRIAPPQLAGPRIDGSVDVEASADQAHARATVRTRTLNQPVTIDATVPIRFPGGGVVPALARKGPVDVHVRAPRVAVADLPPQLQHLVGLTAGAAGLDVAVDGDLRDPRVRLAATVDGLATPKVKGIAGTIHLLGDDRGVHLDVLARLRGSQLLEGAGSVGVTPGELMRTRGRLGNPTVRFDGTIGKFDLGLVAAAVPSVGKLSGPVTGNVQLSGTLQEPRVRAFVAANGANLNGVSFKRLDVRADTTDLRGKPLITARVNAEQAAGGSMHIEAKVAPRAGAAGPLDATLQAQRLDVGFLRTLVPDVREAGGQLSADVKASGTLKAPLVYGSVSVGQGRLGLVGVQTLSDITMQARVSPSFLGLTRLDARAGKGKLHAWASVALRGLTPTKLQAGVTGDGVLISYAGLSNATLGADVTADGALQGNVFDLKVRVRQASLKLPRVGAGRKVTQPLPLKDVVFVDRRPPPPRPERHPLPKRINLAVVVDDFYLHAQEVNAAFRADLKVRTQGNETIIDGVVSSRYGQVYLMGEQYTLDHARVVFNGAASPDPRLDIRLARQLPDATLYIDAKGTLEAPKISLSSDPGIYAQPELLSAVISGEPPGAPGAGGIDTGNALAGIGVAMLGQITQNIVPALPLDVLRVSRTQQHVAPGQQNVATVGTETRIEVGKRLGRKLYIGYTQIINAGQGENSEEVHVQYRLKPTWVIETTYGNAGVGGLDMYWSKRY